MSGLTIYANPFPHKCRTRVQKSLITQYCSYCGIAISSNPAISYLRPSSFDIVNSYIGEQNLIIDNMLKKQNIHLYYSEDASHIPFRHGLVDWLEKTTRKLNLNVSTTHLSVAIIDIVLSCYAVPIEKMETMVFTALNLAAKLNDRDNRLPLLKDVSYYFQKQISISELQNCEKVVFEILGYNSNIQTPFSFACQFISCGVVNNLDIKNKSSTYMLSEFERLLSLFASASLKNYELCRFEASVVGASMIAAVRKELGFKNIWTEHLERLTKTTYNQLKESLHILEEAAYEHYGDEIHSKEILPTPIKRKSTNTLTSTTGGSKINYEDDKLDAKQVFVSCFSFNSDDSDSLKLSMTDELMSENGKEL